jgi:phage baseplate assembly protein W/phage replication-related protein YjqB (UPF0714/DUF867 family)
MATYDASIKRALSDEQDDLIKHKEHCSADPEKLATVGRARGHQVRIKRNDEEYGLYTVSEVRPENPDKIVRMGKGGRDRLGKSDEFEATLDSQVPNATLSDADAECEGEFVERLDNDDDGTHTGLIAIAPHGGDIEPYTDQQAERVMSQLAGKGVSSWRCKGWHPKGAFEHWHITSTDIHEASFPLLNSVISRGFSYAVAFHGFNDDPEKPTPYDILVGGLAKTLKEEVKKAIEGVVGLDFKVKIATPDEPFGGDDKRNIVNRLTAGGRNGIQIEQKKGPREKYALPLADAVARVYESELGLRKTKLDTALLPEAGYWEKPGQLFGRGIGFPPRVGADGRLVCSTGEENVRDSIRIILLTNQRERLRLPEFGGNLGEFLFEPNTVATRHQIQERISRTLAQWEPRVAVESVSVEPDPADVEAAIATIQYRLVATQARERVSVGVSLGA